ncbi:STAS domain-containing protein [Marinitenerispora sediminis]|uniref:Anti-sigma factor antagonist n=1 Tax=Marinitenerispora sediminis TaxID=1931232 RepID=A0A368T4F6_9ACTN|nr:STAS domain-containing protein [Marinitenerispora sediminis]RCV49540.1 anti-anti-sigma factor [Marinitenerispora sediminis]RCV50029.1 anti-anti-sigma factor [Marinitenerispora sediminis]RCV53282.1 anti-anti-sigma factor [Marinitenerispora sediminis]
MTVEHRPSGAADGAVRPAAAAPLTVVTVHEADGRPLVVARGELDVATADALTEGITAAVERSGGEVTVDLSGITFCDAAGLGALVRAANRTEPVGARLILRAPTARLARLLDVTGLARRFPVTPARRGRRRSPRRAGKPT